MKEHFDEKERMGKGQNEVEKEVVSVVKKKLYPTITDLVSDNETIRKETLYNNLGVVSLAQAMNENHLALKQS